MGAVLGLPRGACARSGLAGHVRRRVSARRVLGSSGGSSSPLALGLRQAGFGCMGLRPPLSSCLGIGPKPHAPEARLP